MNATEIAELLTVIAVGDRRTVGEADVIFWHGVLGDLGLEECKRAVVKHAQTSTDFLQPAHIRRLVGAERQDRAMRAERELPGRDPMRSDELVPMPDWFYTSVAEHKRRAKLDREAALERGETPTFGEAHWTAADRRPRASTWGGAA